MYDGSGNEVYDQNGVAFVNPIRWKGHYYDTETRWYYIEGRYYWPAICQYIDAAAPEAVLANAAVINGLNRYGITTNNALALVAALYTIFTLTQLYNDPEYKASSDLTWWQNNKQTVMLVVSIAVMLATMVASFIFPPLAIIAAAIAAGIAILEFVAMGVCNIVEGKPFWDRDVKRAMWGAVIAVAMLVVTIGIEAIMGAMARAADSAAAAKAAAQVPEETSAAAANEAATAAKEPEAGANPLEKVSYTPKVYDQMTWGEDHSFPMEVDNYGALGKQTTFTGGDGKIYTRLTIDGAFRGEPGYFEYIWDENGLSNHRFFVRYNK